MAIITCKHCGHEIVDTEPNCPYCGEPVQRKYVSNIWETQRTEDERLARKRAEEEAARKAEEERLAREEEERRRAEEERRRAEEEERQRRAEEVARRAEEAERRAEEERRAREEAERRLREAEEAHKAAEEAHRAAEERRAREAEAARKAEEERRAREEAERRRREEEERRRAEAERRRREEEERRAREEAARKAEEERKAREAEAARKAAEEARKREEAERMAAAAKQAKAEEEYSIFDGNFDVFDAAPAVGAAAAADKAHAADPDAIKMEWDFSVDSDVANSELKAEEDAAAAAIARQAEEAAARKQAEEEAARKAAEAARKAEEERKAREEAERKAKEEAERKAAEAAEAARKAEEERKAREEAARKAEEERKAREEAARKAEEERKAREEAAKKAEEERKAREEAERKAKAEAEEAAKAAALAAVPAAGAIEAEAADEAAGEDEIVEENAADKAAFAGFKANKPADEPAAAESEPAAAEDEAADEEDEAAYDETEAEDTEERRPRRKLNLRKCALLALLLAGIIGGIFYYCTKNGQDSVAAKQVKQFAAEFVAACDKGDTLAIRKAYPTASKSANFALPFKTDGKDVSLSDIDIVDFEKGSPWQVRVKDGQLTLVVEQQPNGKYLIAGLSTDPNAKPAATKTAEPAPEKPAAAAPAQSAFENVLKSAPEGSKYFLCDVYGDTTPELWIDAGTGKRGSLQVYAFENDSVKQLETTFRPERGELQYRRGDHYVLLICTTDDACTHYRIDCKNKGRLYKENMVHWPIADLEGAKNREKAYNPKEPAIELTDVSDAAPLRKALAAKQWARDARRPPKLSNWHINAKKHDALQSLVRKTRQKVLKNAIFRRSRQKNLLFVAANPTFASCFS